jgi:hypothetical protein
MKVSHCAWFLLPCVQLFAQGVSSEWFPTTVGNQWIYEHEERSAYETKRWQTIETIVGALSIPEGLVLLRSVEVIGDSPGPYPLLGESHYLIRNNCLYFLWDQLWNGEDRQLRPEFRKQLLAGDAEPVFCFPLAIGKQYGKDKPPGWVSARVVGMGPRQGFTPDSVSKNAFDVVVNLVSANETHFWFEKGVGIVGIWDLHHGTYMETRIKLLQFQPASPKVR